MDNELTFQLRQTPSMRHDGAVDACGAPIDPSAYAHKHLQTGLSLYTQGQIPEALWEFFEAAGDEPANPLSHYLSGLALQALGLGEEARDEWRKVLALTGEIHSTAGAESLCSKKATAWEQRMAARLLRNNSATPR